MFRLRGIVLRTISTSLNMTTVRWLGAVVLRRWTAGAAVPT
jgi:hypothetical protein